MNIGLPDDFKKALVVISTKHKHGSLFDCGAHDGEEHYDTWASTELREAADVIVKYTESPQLQNPAKFDGAALRKAYDDYVRSAGNDGGAFGLLNYLLTLNR